MPVIITVANTKGGVGKTTSVVSLASEIKRKFPDAPVTVADMDKQGSASLWGRAASNNNNELPFKVSLANIQSIEWLSDELPDDGFLVIDTAPGDPSIVDAAVKASHFVIIPTAPSGMDMARMWETIRLATNYGKMHAVLITQAVLNSNQLSDAINVLDTQEVSRFNTIVKYLQRYPKQFGTSPERDGAYADVVDELVAALTAQMKEAAQ